MKFSSEIENFKREALFSKIRAFREIKPGGLSSGELSGRFCLETPYFHVWFPHIAPHRSRERSPEHCHSKSFWLLINEFLSGIATPPAWYECLNSQNVQKCLREVAKGVFGPLEWESQIAGPSGPFLGTTKETKTPFSGTFWT